ncbi:MAG: hypothetical protein ACM3MD_03105 [Betaproteobacteria bacterium]
MKKTIMILGYAFLCVIVLVVAGVASVAVIGKRLDKESKAFVDAAVPAIVAEWDIAELQKRASPEFNASVDYDDLADDFETLQQMGKLVEYKGSIGDSNITVSLSGYEITADYTANADFETGSTEMQISLIRHSGQWQILDFTVSPEAFTERKDVI